jgi:hypothetical protein
MESVVTRVNPIVTDLQRNTAVRAEIVSRRQSLVHRRTKASFPKRVLTLKGHFAVLELATYVTKDGTTSDLVAFFGPPASILSDSNQNL